MTRFKFPYKTIGSVEWIAKCDEREYVNTRY